MIFRAHSEKMVAGFELRVEVDDGGLVPLGIFANQFAIEKDSGAVVAGDGERGFPGRVGYAKCLPEKADIAFTGLAGGPDPFGSLCGEGRGEDGEGESDKADGQRKSVHDG